ncbi:MAG: hypothetical protein QM770_08105 [Tepidisphaeraceae bacterium]
MLDDCTEARREIDEANSDAAGHYVDDGEANALGLMIANHTDTCPRVRKRVEGFFHIFMARGGPTPTEDVILNVDATGMKADLLNPAYDPQVVTDKVAVYAKIREKRDAGRLNQTQVDTFFGQLRGADTVAKVKQIAAAVAAA